MWTGFGTAGVQFSAHRYREIEKSLSHPTLAQRERFLGRTVSNDAWANESVRELGVAGEVSRARAELENVEIENAEK
jgi:hypothetical protein